MNGEIKKIELVVKGYRFETTRAKAILGQLLLRQREEQHAAGDHTIVLLSAVDVERAIRLLRDERGEAHRKSARESELLVNHKMASRAILWFTTEPLISP
jgi:hypothetical protein